MSSPQLIQLTPIYRYLLPSLLLILIFCSQALSQTSLTPVLDIKSDKRAWLTGIHVVNKSQFLVTGLFEKRLVLGSDTLRDKNFGDFVAKFENESAIQTLSVKGRLLGIDDKFFCIVGSGTPWYRRQNVSKFDMDNNRIWEYSLALMDSSYARLTVSDICFDESGNTYLLFMIAEGKGRVQINNEIIDGPSDFIVKLNPQGKPIQQRQLTRERHQFNKLRMMNGKICAFGGEKFYHAIVWDSDLKVEIKDDELKELCQYSLWDNENFFRIKQSGSRPDRPYHLEKFNRKSKIETKTMFFRDAVRFQDAIYQKALLDLNNEELVIAYVSRGVRVDNIYKNNINILVIRKENLKTIKHIVIECDHLYMGSAGMIEYIPFQVLGEDLLFGNDYVNYTKLGDLVIGDEDGRHADRSFFIVRQPLK